MIHVVWQLAAVELHCIMQLVTVEVTVLVSGVIGVGACAKTGADRMTDESAAETASSIVTRRMLVSSPRPSPGNGDRHHHTRQTPSYAARITRETGPHGTAAPRRANCDLHISL
jgi:hypothetical protein